VQKRGENVQWRVVVHQHGSVVQHCTVSASAVTQQVRNMREGNIGFRCTRKKYSVVDVTLHSLAEDHAHRGVLSVASRCLVSSKLVHSELMLRRDVTKCHK
jgi:hypothetical protein